MLGLAHLGFSLSDYSQHLIHTLRPVGYTTTLIGHQHIALEPDVIGYDQVREHRGGMRFILDATKDFLQDAPEPFFLSVGFFETHREFPWPESEEMTKYSRPPAPLPDTPQTREEMASFMTSLGWLDNAIGEILEALDENDLSEHTLLICTTDHGIAFPGMKCTLTDHGVGVFLIMRGPGGFQGGRVCDAMVSHIDLFPTLCDFLEVEEPPWLQGDSLMPLIHGEVEEIHEELFAEVTYHAAYEPQRAVRTRRWKYIRRFEDREKPVLPNIDDGLSKELWMEHGLRDRVIPHEQLYDLIFDPQEANNLAADPAYGGILKEMRGRLHRWMFQTEDPLLEGSVPAPIGAELNDPEDTSPNDPTLIVGEGG
jgi:arylsulfatase A-like enzyme